MEKTREFHAEWLSLFLNVYRIIFRVKRQATGIWKCLRCKKVMAGGAYVLRYINMCRIVFYFLTALSSKLCSTAAAVTVRTAISRLKKSKTGEVV